MVMSKKNLFSPKQVSQCLHQHCETSRGLVVAWFGGTAEKNKDVGIWVSYHDGSLVVPKRVGQWNQAC